MAEEYDLSNPEDVSRRKTATKLTRRRYRDVVNGIMGHPEGRAWMFDLLARCTVFHSTFSTDALQMAFNEGQRNVGLSLIASILPEHYVLMLTEQRDGRSRDNPSDAE